MILVIGLRHEETVYWRRQFIALNNMSLIFSNVISG
jgi:hypothetical protein